MVYDKRFNMPKPPGPQKVAGGYLKRSDAPGSFKGKSIKPRWYSYDHGPIHFIAYRSEGPWLGHFASSDPYMTSQIAFLQHILPCFPMTHAERLFLIFYNYM